MPYVNIRVTRDGVSLAQKERLIRGVTQLLNEVLAKDPKLTMVVIDEVELDNWGYDSQTMSAYRAQGAAT